MAIAFASASAGAFASARAGLEAVLAAERGRLALWLPVALGAGCLLYFSLHAEPDPAWRWCVVPLLILAWALSRHAPHAAWLAGLGAAAALGFAVASWHAGRQPPALVLPPRAVVLSGIVQSVDLLPAGRRVTLAAVRIDPAAPPLARTLRVRLRATDPARPAPGDTVSVRALIRPPSPPAYPGAWDFQRGAYLAGQGGAGFAIGVAEVTPGTGATPPLAAMRASIEARVTSVIPGGAGAVAAALLTSGQSAIPAADLTAMRDSGLAHLLSVSGLHIAIVMGLTFATLRLLIACVPWLALRVPGKTVAAAGGLVAGGFYLLLTGSQVPMLRSFAMAALVTLALVVGRRAISLRTLALAAAVVLLVQPAAVLGPSFQMSFAAVLALIAGWEAARGRLQALRGDGAVWRRALVWAIGMIGTSVLAGAATTPFGLHHFGRLQWYGVAANAVAVPITSVCVMPAGMLAALLMPFGLDGPALWVMGQGVEAILAIARIVAGWPGAASSARPIPAWGLGVLAFGMCWLGLWRTRWRLWGVVPIAIGMASPIWTVPPDLLVSSDARLIALRTDRGLFLQRVQGASNLTRDSFLRAHGGAAAAILPLDGAVGGGAITCTPGACAFRRGSDATLAVLLRGDPPRAYCGTVPVIVAAEPVRGFCRGSAVVDRFAVWRDGAHAVWFEASGPRVVSDRAFRGARPWVPPRPIPRGQISDEPAAAVE